METDKLISPVVDFSEKDEWNCDRLYTGFRNHGLNLSKKEIKEAFKLAKEKRERENERHEIFAEEIVKDLSNQAEPLLVIMGRSYNLYDEKLNLELIKDTAGYGLTILPFDLFPDGRERLSDCDKNMYWSYGQRFLTLAEKLKHYDNIHPIFLTNFNCGPDSFILSFLEDVWQDKPFLILELDEHNGNAGYLTRVEAFLDRIKEHKPKNATSPKAVRLREQKKSSIDKENGSLIFPPMHPYGTRLVAAAFTGYGYESVALTEENEETFQKGKSCLRGSECLPAATTLGSFLKHYEEKQLNNDDSTEKIPVMFMPSACGPCRFGQYGTLHSSVFERMNIKSSILSLSSEDNYSGFSSKMRLQIIKSIIATDIIEKIGTRIRPYSSDPQKIEELLESFISRLMQAFEKRKSISKTLGQIKDSLNSEIETSNSAFNESKPLVGIVGEIYVRSSIFSNDDLLRKIEANNAEAWLTPFMEWFHYTSWLKLNRKEKVVSSINDLVTDKLVSAIEKRYYSIFAKFLSERIEPSTEQIVSRAKPYLTPAVRGEAILTIGRSILFIEQGAKLIINVSPFSCMPGTIASTILRNISSQYSVPIVSLYYDGYSSFDDEIEHYLNNLNGIRK